MLECELKFRFEDPSSAERLLEERGVALSEPVAESNSVLDLPDRSLGAGGILLRVRDEGGSTVLTVKVPVPDPSVKVRREHETAADCTPRELEALLGALGYGVVARYSKTRRTGMLGAVKVCLDTLWFGTFVELEASDTASLEEAVKALGFDRSAVITKNYLELEREARG